METFRPISDEGIEELHSRPSLWFDIDDRADGLILRKGWTLILDGTQLFYEGKLIGEVKAVAEEDENE